MQDPAAEMRRIWHQPELPDPEASLATIRDNMLTIRGCRQSENTLSHDDVSVVEAH